MNEIAFVIAPSEYGNGPAGGVEPRRGRDARERFVQQRDGRTSDAAWIQRLVSYLVRTTPSGNVRVSTRFRFTQLSRAVKNGVPPPTRTGG